MSGRTLLLWAHPALGLAVTALAVRQASLGLQARAAGRAAARARAQHRAVGPWLWALAVVSWIGGVLTVWLDRDDLAVGESGHFQVGLAIVLLLSAGAWLSRRIPASAVARAVHPWLGAAAVLAAGIQVFLGLQLMPQ